MHLLRDAFIQDSQIGFLQDGHGLALIGYQDIHLNFSGCDGELGLLGGGRQKHALNQDVAVNGGF